MSKITTNLLLQYMNVDDNQVFYECCIDTNPEYLKLMKQKLSTYLNIINKVLEDHGQKIS